jgi:hypothetical protein
MTRVVFQRGQLIFSIKVRHPWDVVESLHTPETVYHSRQQYRREFLKLIGYSTLGAALTGPLVGCSRPTQDQTGIAEAVGVTPEEQAVQAGEVKPLPEDQARLYPARRNQASPTDARKHFASTQQDTPTFLNSHGARRRTVL